MRYPTFVYAAIILIAICLYFLRVQQSYKTEYFTNMNSDQRPLRVFMHGFWNNPKPFVFKFFKEICQVAFNRQCEYGNENDSDIIVQSVFTNDKDILKKFKYKILYSAENWKFDPNFYDVLLTYEHTNGKNIRCPYFLVEKSAEEFAQLEQIHKIPRTTFPQKDVLVVISNAGAEVRNKFLNELDKHFNVDYGGAYKNNIGGKIKYDQNSEEYKNIAAQYKFIITMENSEAPHYVTEKILQGMRSQIIPIYWGASSVGDYFNTNRFIQLKDSSETSIREVIEKMKELQQSPQKWFDIVNQPVFTNHKLDYGVQQIGLEMRKILDKNQNIL